MHLFLAADDSEAELIEELRGIAGCTSNIRSIGSSLVQVDSSDLLADQDLRLAYGRQVLPDACPVHAQSIRGWARQIFEAEACRLQENQPWSLHVVPHYATRPVHRIGARAWHSLRLQHRSADRVRELRENAAIAGVHRSELVREELLALMRQKRRHVLRALEEQPVVFRAEHSLLQVWMTSPQGGYVSLSQAPSPYKLRHVLSPFPKGQVATAGDKQAPSRAFAKLVEAETRMGRRIGAGDVCVDLGAAPGSWTWVAVNRGAKVMAIDRSPLRDDLMRNPRVEVKSADAFEFQPASRADWLLCDIIASPEQTARLLRRWLQEGWCRFFVVTLKMKETSGLEVIAQTKKALVPLTKDFFVLKLCANKKELCVFGEARS